MCGAGMGDGQFFAGPRLLRDASIRPFGRERTGEVLSIASARAAHDNGLCRRSMRLPRNGCNLATHATAEVRRPACSGVAFSAVSEQTSGL